MSIVPFVYQWFQPTRMCVDCSSKLYLFKSSTRAWELEGLCRPPWQVGKPRQAPDWRSWGSQLAVCCLPQPSWPRSSDCLPPARPVCSQSLWLSIKLKAWESAYLARIYQEKLNFCKIVWAWQGTLNKSEAFSSEYSYASHSGQGTGPTHSDPVQTSAAKSARSWSIL